MTARLIGVPHHTFGTTTAPEIGRVVVPDGLEELFDHDENWVHAVWLGGSNGGKTLCGNGDPHVCHGGPVTTRTHPTTPMSCPDCGSPFCPDCRLIWNEQKQ